MGIRYYAYAFDVEFTERALADPRSAMGSDPLEDAWGLDRGAASSVMGKWAPLAERDFLYLDKAWRDLQAVTRPRVEGAVPRPAYGMFEGDVAWSDHGYRAWVRVVPPDDVLPIARDLETISNKDVADFLSPFLSSHQGQARDEELRYVTDYLRDAKRFVHLVAAERRGFAYMLG